MALTEAQKVIRRACQKRYDAKHPYNSLTKEEKATKKERDKRHYQKNKKKIIEQNRAYAKANIEQTRMFAKERSRQMTRDGNVTGRKDTRLKRIYGITLEDYNKLFTEQKGCCAICYKHQSELNKTLAIDHNHETNKVRALLCNNCNTGLGRFEEDIEVLQNAIKYLEHYRKISLIFTNSDIQSQ